MMLTKTNNLAFKFASGPEDESSGTIRQHFSYSCGNVVQMIHLRALLWFVKDSFPQSGGALEVSRVDDGATTFKFSWPVEPELPFWQKFFLHFGVDREDFGDRDWANAFETNYKRSLSK